MSCGGEEAREGRHRPMTVACLPADFLSVLSESIHTNRTIFTIYSPLLRLLSLPTVNCIHHYIKDKA